MLAHRRGRSLSDALTLEQCDGGALVVSSAVPNQGLKEGDEVLGATIDFEELSKDEVLHVLKLMEPFNDKIKVLTRNNRSKSVGNLAECGGNPEEMLKDSYNRLYNSKIKKFIRNDPDEKTSSSRNVQASTKLNTKYDMELPRLGVDFGLLKKRTPSEGPDESLQPDDHRELSYDNNLNLPPMGVGLNGAALVGTKTVGYDDSAQLQAPDLQQPGTLSEYSKVTSASRDAEGPSIKMPLTHVEGSVCENYSKGTFTAPELGIDMNGSRINTPGSMIKLNGGPEGNMKTEVSLHNIGPKYSKKLKNPDLDVDDPSNYVKPTKLRLSKKLKSPDLDIDLAYGGHLPEFGVSGKKETFKTPDLSLETPKPKGRIHQPKLASNVQSGDIKGPSGNYIAPEFKMPKFDLPELQIPNFTEDYRTPDMQFKAPQIRGGIDADLDMPNMDLKTPQFYVTAPGVSIGSPKSKFKMPKLNLPKLNTLGLKGPDIDASLEGPDMDVNVPGINPKGPKADVELPNLDVGEQSGKLNMPNVSLGDLKLSGPNLGGTDFKLKKPNFDVSGSHLEGGINVPDINMPAADLNGPRMDLPAPKLSLDKTTGKVKMPDFHTDWDMKGSFDKLKPPKLNLGGTLPRGPNLDLNADIGTPDLNLRAPKIKGGIDAPDLDMPNMDLKAPKIDVNAPGVSIDSPKSKFKKPKLKLRKFSLPGIKAPDIDGSMDVPDMDVNAPKIDLKGPKADFETPNLDVGGLSGKLNMPNVNLGDLKLSGPNLDGPNLKLKKPNFDVSGPHLEGGINAPDINMPKTDFKGPNLDFDAPKLSLNKPSGKAKMPDLHTPDWDLKASIDKLKPPKLNFRGTLPRGPNLDLNADVEPPDLNMRAPRIKGGIDAPHLDMPSVDLKAPEFDVNAPGVSIDSPKSKFKFPKLKLPKFSLPGIKGPDIDGSLDVPDMDVSSPNIDLKCPKADVEMPNLDVGGPSGKLNMPDLNLGDLELSGPNLDDPNLKLKKPNFGVSGPHLKGGINAADINMPTTNLNDPRIDLHTPKFSLGKPSGKIKMPELHSPDWDLKASVDKFKLPKLNVGGTLPRRPNLDLNADVGTPDLNLRAPKIKGGIDAPDLDMPNMDLKAPKIDVNAPGVSISSPKSKFKKPKLKLRKFSLPGIKAPDIDGSMDVPDMDVNAPKIDLKGPKADFEMPNLDVGGLSGKLNMPNVNLGDLKLSGPNLDGPNLKLKKPDFNVSGPHLEGGINAPDINMPKTDLKGPKLDLHNPKLSLDKPSGKIKMPDLHTPDWDLMSSLDKLKLPKLNAGGTLPRGPNLDLNADVGTPDLNLRAPKIKGGIDAPDLNMPNMDLKAPEFDVNAPGVSIDSPKSKFKFPKLKLPKFSLSGLKGPDIDGSLDVQDMDVNAPKIELKGPKADVEMPNLDGGLSGKLKMPNASLGNLGLSGPKLDAPNLDLNTPNFGMSGPHLEGGLNAPDINMLKTDLKGPKLDLHTPKLNLDKPSGKIKMPGLHTPDWDLTSSFDKLKLPKLNAGGTLPRGPNLDLNADVGTPDLNLRAPKIKGGIEAPDLDMPNMDLKAPKIDINAPGVSIDSPKTKFRMPKLNMPKFSTPGLKGPEIDGSLDVPDMDVDAPRIELKSPKAKMPDLDVSGLSGKFKKPNLNLGDIKLSGPKLDGPKLDLDAPNFDIPGPRLGGGISAPDVNMPTANLRGPRMDLNAPKLNVGGTLPRGPNLDLNADVGTPDINLPAPKVKGGIDAPDVDMPNLNLKAPEFSSPKSKFKIPKVKWPKFSLPGLKGPDIEGNLDGPNMNINAPNLNLKSPKAGMEIPDVDFPNLSAGIDSPDLDLGLNSPKLDVNAPEIKFDSPKTKMKFPKLNLPAVNLPNLKTPELDGSLNSPDISIKAPTTKVKGSKPGFQMPEVDFGGQSERFQVPHLKMPNVGFSSPEIDASRFDFGPPDISAKLPKEPNFNTPDVGLNSDLQGPGITLPNLDMNFPKEKIQKPSLNGPYLSGPKVRMRDINLPDNKLKSHGVDLNRTFADVGFDGNITVPQVKGGLRSPNFELNAPAKNFPASHGAESDIDFGASLRPASLDISPPNAKMYMKSPQLMGNMSSPNITAPNVNHNIPKVLPLQSPQTLVRNPDLNLDDAGIKLRSSYPVERAGLGHYADFNRSDLNIDDFTGRDHVLRARGSRPDLRTSQTHKKVIPQSRINVDMKDPRLSSGMPRGDIVIYSRPQKSGTPSPKQQTPHINPDLKNRVPKSSGGYYVTVFPTDIQNQRIPGRKRNTIGHTEFQTTNLDLEVPRNDTKGSTSYFYDLV